MRLKIYLFLLFFTFFSRVNSQIAITEIYYNTPYNESLKYTSLNPNPNPNITKRTAEHHRGEFIELYNYSDTDINLSGWYLRDLVGTYWLPNRVLKSGEFLVVAYGKQPQEDYFPTFFNTTQGKENQIIYQNAILLRNKAELVVVGTDAYNGQMPIKSDFMYWNNYSNPSTNFIPNSWENSNNFYGVNSFQWVGVENYTEATPNPLDATTKPPITSLKDILSPYYYENYSSLNWSENVLNITNNTCPTTIAKEEQIPSGTYESGNKCFSYDLAGNIVDILDCTTSTPNTPPSNSLTDDELENIRASITVAPNPTSSNVNIYWNGVVLNKVYNLQVYSSSGVSVFNFSPSAGVNSASFSLQGQLPGTYIAKFTLNTGQVVTKNILKW